MKRFLLFIIFIVCLLPTIKANAELGNVWYQTQANGDVIQTLYINSTQTINLTFGFCNGLTCGDADPECFSNKYIPSFVTTLPIYLKINPLPGATAKKIYFKTGPVAGVTSDYGYWDQNSTNDWNDNILARAPIANSDGSVDIKFDNPLTQQFNVRYSKITGGICGISEEEHTAFIQKNGTTYNNFYSASKKIAIVWSKPNNSGVFPQKITLDSLTTSQNAAVENISNQSKNKSDYKFDANYSNAVNWSTKILNENNLKINQQDEKNKLESAGVITNNQMNFKNFITYLNNQKILTNESTITDVALNPNHDYWTVYTKNNQNIVAKIGSYNPKKDSFQIENLSGQKDQIKWDDLTKGQPWIIKITQ